jgi:uncharacterized protein (DUF2252 family)
MANDLAGTPTSGITVQVCGDAHLVNFGLFGSPERHLVFSLNDFDETLPGPWEWDLKRLAASVAVAARQNGFSHRQQHDAARETVRAYREAMLAFAEMPPWTCGTCTCRPPRCSRSPAAWRPNSA